eukprot:jgi/Botrbrau1/18922/Bobra.177_2s0076.1
MKRVFCRLILLGLFASYLAAGEVSDPVLDQKLKQAEEIQEDRQEAGTVVAKVIKEAPEATLNAGTGDVSTTGDCAGDIDNFCGEVKAGVSRLADCLSKQLEEEEKGNVQGKKLTEACKKELADFKIDLGTNINKNLPLAEACKDDAAKLCKDEDATDPGAILPCLREHKDGLSKPCSEEVFKTQLEAAKDFRTDADLYAACDPDAKTLCADVKPGEGRIQACLRDKQAKLSWECQEELFRQEVENADNIMLNYRLMRKCMGDKKKFCPKIEAGNARVKDCLEENRNKEDFSPECKEEFEKMMEQRSVDFRLDSSLRDACSEDIDLVCGFEKESMDNVGGFDASVVSCLQDYKEELTSDKCKEEVHKVMKRASEDIRFDASLSEACYEDRQQLCAGYMPGSARVIRCLQDNREELRYDCRAMLFDQEVRMAEDIDFKYPMKVACTAEINKFCGTVQKGEARVIQCLQQHLDEVDMSSECKQEIERDMLRSSQDYRLNYRLARACEEDRLTLCGDLCQENDQEPCGGRVLQCLTQHYDDIKSQDCQNEVFYFEKMEVTDFRNDVLLAEACRSDVDRWCKNVPPGEGRVIECLRDHRADLEEECRKEELKLAIVQSRDVRLRPKLHKACSEEIAIFCKDVRPGKGRVFKCLQESIAKPDFGQNCAQEVEKRATRMQEDYRLDYGIATKCESDVNNICASEKSKAHGNATVLKCLVAKYKEIADEQCMQELSRAVRMALWDFKKGAALTGVCDVDVDKVCQKKEAAAKKAAFNIGYIGKCLSRQLALNKPMQPSCRALVIVAAPREIKEMMDQSMPSEKIVEQLVALQQAAGITANTFVDPNVRGVAAITLSGWAALAALIALVIVVVGTVVFGYRRYMGLDKPYTIVTKSGDV